jgi:glycosyltransferase involved in cell wall biosynthesis
MNILGVFLNNQARTGGDRRYLELMEDLAARGNNVIVLMNSFYNYQPKHIKAISLSIRYIRHKPPPASYLFKKKTKKDIDDIKRQIREYNCKTIDFIHIHGDMHLKTAIFLKKQLKSPLFYASRCNDIDRAKIMRASGSLALKQRLFSLVYDPVNRSREKQIARHTDLITHQNQQDADCFINRAGAFSASFREQLKARTVIIPGNIGPPRCKAEWQDKNKSGEVKKIVYVGSLSAGKGFWDLLKALGELKKKGRAFLSCLALGREENMGQTLHLIQELGIEEMVSIEGFKDPFPYLADSDLMVYPTLYDAYPDAVLEALHTGCPVIAASVGGIPDLLQYPELLFKSGNVNEIAEKIELCITDNEFYQKIRFLCAERAKAHRFDWAGRFEAAMSEFIIGQKTCNLQLFSFILIMRRFWLPKLIFFFLTTNYLLPRRRKYFPMII